MDGLLFSIYCLISEISQILLDIIFNKDVGRSLEYNTSSRRGRPLIFCVSPDLPNIPISARYHFWWRYPSIRSSIRRSCPVLRLSKENLCIRLWRTAEKLTTLVLLTFRSGFRFMFSVFPAILCESRRLLSTIVLFLPLTVIIHYDYYYCYGCCRTYSYPGGH